MTARLRVLHVVVGAGNVNYFLNCLRSVRRLEAGSVFAVYNWVNNNDRALVEAKLQEIWSLTSQFVLQQNSGPDRTGSLYVANNLGLQFASASFDFVNFVQADMQMVWWSERLLSGAKRIAELKAASGERSLTFFTQLPVAGKRPEPYAGWDWSQELETFETTGFSDVCLVPLTDGLNETFHFAGNERSMSASLKVQATPLVYHTHPFIAPIPFPDNLRQRSRTKHPELKAHTPLFLRINSRATIDLNTRTLHPVFMEDAVFPDGWACAVPYWPSDTRGTRWIRAKWPTLRKNPLSLFDVRKKNGDRSRFVLTRFEPGYLRTAKSLFQFLVEEALSKLRNSVADLGRRSKL